MLEPEQQSQKNWHLIIESKERTWVDALLHEGQIRAEEKYIVVVADEAMPGCECFDKSIATLGDCLGWCMLRRNGLRSLIFVHYCGGKMQLCEEIRGVLTLERI